MPSTEVKHYAQGGPENIQNAWRLMAGGAETCVKALLDVAEHSESDAARVSAAGTVLDRLGMGARPEVTVRVVPSEFDDANGNVDGGMTPGDIVRKRLLELAAASATASRVDMEEDQEILDAILVEED